MGHSKLYLRFLFSEHGRPQKWIHPAKDLLDGSVCYNAKVLLFLFHTQQHLSVDQQTDFPHILVIIFNEEREKLFNNNISQKVDKICWKFCMKI